MFQPLNNFFARVRANIHADPVRDWLLLVTLATIALAGIVVWNVWAFDTVANGGAIGNEVPNASLGFNRASLDTIQNIFTSRAVEETKYVTGVYKFADPSQ